MLNFSFYAHGWRLKCEYEFDVIQSSIETSLGCIRNFYCDDECTAHKAVIYFNQHLGDYHPTRFINFRMKRITIQ